MDDWIAENPGWCLITLLITFATLLIILFTHEERGFRRLMQQCLADGKKEYECHAMLDNHQRVVPMPIVIPAGH